MKAGKNGIGSKGKGKEIKKNKTPREIRTGRGSERERKGEQRGKKEVLKNGRE